MQCRVFCLCALFVANGCTRSDTPLQPPPTIGAGTLVVAFQLAIPRVFVFDVARSDISIKTELPEDGVKIHAVIYDNDPATLGLVEGELIVEPSGRPLPESVWPLLVSKAGDESGSWVASDDLTFVRNLRVRATDPCLAGPHFALQNFEMDTSENGRELIALGEDHVLLTTQSGRFYDLSRDRLTRIPFGEAIPSGALWRAPDGDLWHAGNSNELVRTRDRAVVERFGIPGPVGSFQRLAGNASGSEMILLDFKTSRVLAFDGEHFEELVTGPRFGDGDVAFEDGAFWIARNTTSFILRVEHGRVTQESVNAGYGVSAFALHPDGRAFAGTLGGTLFRRERGHWVTVGDLGSGVYTIAPYGDGFIAGGAWGQFAMWRPEVGLCLDQILPGIVERLLPMGDDIAVSMLNDQWETPLEALAPTFATWMERVR